MLLGTAIGFLLAVLTGFANASMRRLIITGSVGLLITFAAFPFTRVSGFLSREGITPTLLGLLPIHPAFALIAITGIVGVAASLLFGRRLAGIVGILGGATTLLTFFSWQARGPSLAKLLPLGGLMEVLTGLILAVVIIALTWSMPRLRFGGLAIGLLLGIVSSLWLASSAGHNYFPNAQGYYQLLTNVPQGTEATIIELYNDGLEQLNSQRRTIGLAPLEPLTSITRLEGQRLPREAAAAGFRLIEPQNQGYGTSVLLFLAGLMMGGGLMLSWRPRLQATGDLGGGIIFAGVVCVLAPAFASTEFSFPRLAKGWPFLLNFLDRSWPPSLTALQEVASQMLITVEIALVGTFLAAIFAIPLSFLAARNLTQGNSAMRTVFGLTRGFFNIDRGIDALILALVFVAAVGLGPFAGVLAMAIHSIADLGKVYSESIENVERGPIEALEAVGASGSNVVRWAILPQVAPLFVAWTLYRFEINFRVSIVLGLVGAGGIGFFIQEKMGTGSYNQMVVAIIAIVLVVNIIDFASSWLRGRLI